MAIDIAAIKVMRGQFTPAQYIGYILPHVQNMKPAELDEILPYDIIEFENYEPLKHLAGSKALSVKGSRWLASLAGKAPTDCFESFCMPFFTNVLEKEIIEDIPVDTENVLLSIGGNRQLVEYCVKRLNCINEGVDNELFISGMIMTVGASKQECHGELICRFLYDQGYWDSVIAKIFEKASMENIIKSLENHGVLASLERSRQESKLSGKSLAESLALDTNLHRQLARLVSANSFIIAMLKIALDRKAISEMIKDKDIHRRRTAAYSLKFITRLTDPEPLKNGLSDADKCVRRYSLESLTKHIGKAEIDEYLQQMKNDASSIKTMSEELSSGIFERGKEVLSGVKDTASNVIEGVGSKFSGLFKKDK